MTRLASTIPAALSIEPVSMIAYDHWQDREGLVDATPECRAAWAVYRGEWRGVRDADLAERDEPVDAHRTVMPDSLLRCARAFGYAERRGPLPKLTAAERKAWHTWKQRVMRADAAVWWAIWDCVAMPQSMVAARHDMPQSRINAAFSLCCMWWLELWPGGSFQHSNRGPFLGSEPQAGARPPASRAEPTRNPGMESVH